MDKRMLLERLSEAMKGPFFRTDEHVGFGHNGLRHNIFWQGKCWLYGNRRIYLPNF